MGGLLFSKLFKELLLNIPMILAYTRLTRQTNHERTTMKTCSKCKIEKPFEGFSRKSSTKDGYRGQCKACVAEYKKSPRAKASWAKYQKSPKGKAADAKYKKSPKGKAVHAKAQAKFHKKNYIPSPEWEIKKHLPHTMYLIRFTQGNRTYIKPGITGRTIKERFSKDIYNGRMSNFELLDSITFKDFETCNVAESIIHDATLDSHVTPVIAFVGSVNECRQPEALEQIISMFDSARAGLDNTN